MASLRISILSNGELITPTSVVLADDGSAYGIRKVSDLTTITNPSVSMDVASKGLYTHAYSNSTAELVEYSVKMVYDSQTYYVSGTTSIATQNVTVSLPSTAYYTSQAEVLRVMGDFAESLLMDDAKSKNSVWKDVLEDVTDTINMYAMQHYNLSDLSTSKWIRRRATYLAANILSNRRGNPPLFTSRVERVYDELNEVRDNRFRIPNVPVKYFQGPVVRNYVVQPLGNHSLRVETTKSTGKRYNNQDDAYLPYIYYGILY